VAAALGAAETRRAFAARFERPGKPRKRWRAGLEALAEAETAAASRVGAGLALSATLAQLAELFPGAGPARAARRRAALARFTQQLRRDPGAVVALAPTPARAALAKLTVAQWGRLKPAAYHQSESLAVVSLVDADDPDRWVALRWRDDGRQARIDRVDHFRVSALAAGTPAGKAPGKEATP
jgi:hypothetical protein